MSTLIDCETVRSALQTLVNTGVLAPSGDNTQPWSFELDCPNATIRVSVDESRDQSPMNAGQRMARIALGAAVENMLRTALKNGWQPTLESPNATALAEIRLDKTAIDTGNASGPQIEPILQDRVTNRREYSGALVADELLQKLKDDASGVEGATLHWITESERLRQLATLIGKTDATLFGNKTLRREFVKNVRFDAQPDEPVNVGLSLGSLEAKPSEKTALRLMGKMPNWLMKLGKADKAFADNARRLVESASGMCIVSVAQETFETDLQAGRAMERAWLTLNAAGLAVQPMMSLLVLENLMVHGSAELKHEIGTEHVATLSQELRAIVPETENRILGFMMRFGYGEAPTGRTGRLPLNDVITEI